MLNKSRLKSIFFLVGVALFAIFGAVGISLLTEFIVAFQQGANPASIFRGHKLIIPDTEIARWVSINDSQGSIPTRAQQEEIIAAYWSGWEALGRAHFTGDTRDLLTYWTGDAYQEVITSINSDVPLEQTHGGHKLRLIFLSDDGSVAAFDDEDFMLQQTLENRTLTLQMSASVVMTLDNGFWRIRVMIITYH